MKVLHHRLMVLAIFLLMAMLLYPPRAHAIFKCMIDGQIEYTDRVCGPAMKLQDTSGNSYSGKLRPGERAILNNINTLPTTSAGNRNNGEGSYSEQLKKYNEEKSKSAAKPKRHRQRYEDRGANPWR